VSRCIICLQSDRQESVEHIIPRTLGIIHYVLPKGVVCQRCNNRLSRSEHAVLNSQEFYKARRQQDLVSEVAEVLPHELSSSHLTKFLTKVFFEALFASRCKVWSTHELEHVRRYLNGDDPLQCEVLSDKTLKGLRPIPRWMDRWRLKRNGIKLGYTLDKSVIYFSFSYTHLHYLLIIR